jgi:hypothetical protein
LKIKRQLGDQYGIAVTLGALGTLLIGREKYIEALPYTLQAYKILERLQNADVKKVMNNLNIIRNALGDKEYQERLKGIEKISP